MRRIGLVIDVAAVVAFVVIGRNTHGHPVSFGGDASTAWPFLCGLGVGWIVAAITSRGPASISGGAEIVISTVALGMVLRVLAGQGTAVAFILVAFGFFGVTMIGWRSIARRRPVGLRPVGDR